MKTKRILGAITAIAMSASAFAGLGCVASADTNELYERGTTTAWSESDLSEWTLTGSSSSDLTINATHGLYATNNLTGYVTKTFSVTDKAIVTYDIDFYTSGNTGRAANYEYIRIGSALTIGYVYYTGDSSGETNIQAMLYSLDGGTTYSDEKLAEFSSTSGTTTNIKAVIDTSTGYLESLTVGGTEVSSAANQYLGDSATYDSVSMGFVRAASVNWTVSYGISAISITEETQDVEMVGYTVRYLDSSTNSPVKDAVTDREGVVGKSASATSADIASFTAGGYKYTYNESMSASTATIEELTQTAEDNVITLYFDAHEAVDIIVTATCGEDLTLYTDEVSVYEGDSYSYTPYAYYEYTNDGDSSNDGFYVYSGLTETGGVIAISGDEATSGDTIDIAYTKVTDESMIYYSEMEKLGNIDDSYADETSSGGVYCAAAGDAISSLGTFSEGSYVLTVRFINRTDRGVYLRDISDSDYTNYIDYVDFSSQGSSAGLKTISFTLDADTEIGISGWYPNSVGKINQSAYIDYIIISKAPSITVTSTSMGAAIDDESLTVPTISGDVIEVNEDGTDGDSVSYNTLVTSGGNVVNTIYVKVTNPDGTTEPTITIGGVEYTPQWTPVTGTSASYYFAQFIGDVSEFGEVLVYYGDDYSAEVPLSN